MKRWAPVMMFLLITSACSQHRVKSNGFDLLLRAVLSNKVEPITVDSLQKIRSNVVLLDARSPQEYKVSHIRGAQYVGYKQFDSASVTNINREAPVVVYCAIGYRSEKVGKKLQKMGFEDVSNLYGGIFEWKNEGHTVVNANGPTDSVHAYSKLWGIWLNQGIKVYHP